MSNTKCPHCFHFYSDHQDEGPCEEVCTLCSAEKESEELDGMLAAKDSKLGI